MDHEEFRVKGKEMVDYIADYLENIRDRRVYPAVQPGYLHKLLPKQAPEQPEKWDDIFKDVESHIMPGIVHWQSPHMHAYFPALTSYPSILGEMLSSGLNVLCFTWASSPAGTELETIAMNWLGKALGLPDCFLNEKDNSPGGGVIQSTASEATLVSLLAARTSALMKLSKLNPEVQSAELLGHLICYCSDQAHSSVEKAGLIGLVRMRYIDSDENQSMRGDKLEEAILSDKAKGLVPFWVCATLGTTGSVAFDNLREIGEVCERHSAWLHVDAAYAGTAFFCPEYRHWLSGVEMADSFAFNPSKWMMVNFDCTAMWVKDSTALHRTFNVNPIYLRHENSGKAIDYMHWQIPLSRRFRALKLWFVLRNYGISGLQKHVREGVRLAQKFEALILSDSRFEVPQPRNLGLVVFRLKGDNALTERLLKRLNARGHIHAVPACFKGTYVIRFTVTSPRTTNQDILDDWEEIKTVATEILREEFGSDDGNIVIPKKLRVSLKGFTNGVTPHMITSPIISRCILKQETKILHPNQSHTPVTPSSQYISKSIDISIPTLQLNDAKICFDINTSEIKLTQTGTKKDTINGYTGSNFIQNGVKEVKVNGNNGINILKADIKKVTVNSHNNINFTQTGTNEIVQTSVDKPLIGNKITQAFEHLYRQTDSDYKTETKKDDSNTKHTIRGPGLIYPVNN